MSVKSPNIWEWITRKMRKYFERKKNENMTYKICGLYLEQYSKGNVCIFMYFASVCVQACTCSVMSNSATPWTAAHQAPLSLGFSRQEYWSGLPFPSPEDLPNPGIEPTSSAPPALAVRLFTTEHLGSPCVCVKLVTCKI